MDVIISTGIAGIIIWLRKYQLVMEGKMKEFFDFKKMITPVIIQVLFWLGVIVSVLISVVIIIAGAKTPYGGGWIVLSIWY